MSEDKIIGCIIAGVVFGAGAGEIAYGQGRGEAFSFGIGFISSVVVGFIFVVVAKLIEIAEDR